MTAPALDTPDFPSAPPPRPSLTAAEQATAILNRPLAAAMLGSRPAEQRQKVSALRKVWFVLSPLVTVPLKAGVGTVVGSLALGAAAGAVVPAIGGPINGYNLGIMGAAILTGPVMAVGTLAGVIKMASRSRQDLGALLDQRRREQQMKDFRKEQKKALKARRAAGPKA